MWKVQYKPNNDSQPWTTLQEFSNKAGALLHASSVSRMYYMVKVVDPDGIEIWST